jgi:hypothetical protein
MAQGHVLTAEEAADRIAARHGNALRHPSLPVGEEAFEPSGDDADATPAYTCENCMNHELMVVHTYDERRTIREELPCSCGATDIAAVRESDELRTQTRAGRLDAGHRVDWRCEDYEEYNEVEQSGREEMESDINCTKCFRNAASEDWESEVLEDWETDEESEIVEVRCATCDHEIEFGWSHPDRGGRIWPCESSDFNPWKCWPEPRFIKAWERRGWLRPKSRELPHA